MRKFDEGQLEELRKRNNPRNEPTGPWTGRCKHCGSTDLWDDATAYGCNCCDALFVTGSPAGLLM